MSCNHPNPQLCQILGQHIYGRTWDIWHGTVLTVEKCHYYRAEWCQNAGIKLSDALAICPISTVVNQQPNIIDLSINFAKAYTQHVKTPKDERYVDDETYKTRLATCDNCIFKSGTRCLHKKCGCNLAIKAKWATEKCPIDKWPTTKES